MKNLDNQRTSVKDKMNFFLHPLSEAQGESLNCIKDGMNIEMLTANMLEFLKIPYLYEKELQIKPVPRSNQTFLLPDFTIKLHGKSIYIEILGMMENENYKNQNLRKLAEYQINGIVPGQNLLCISTGYNGEFNQKKLKNIFEDLINHNKIPSDIIDIGLDTIRKNNNNPN